MSLEVHQCSVKDLFAVLHELIFFSNCAIYFVFLHELKVLLAGAPQVTERVGHCASTKSRCFARDCHDPAECLAIAPWMGEL